MKDFFEYYNQLKEGKEKDGAFQMIRMMLSMRQQIFIRTRYDEWNNNK